jgi:gamma-glutamyltranspeptidase/glutathione hydrolase
VGLKSNATHDGGELVAAGGVWNRIDGECYKAQMLIWQVGMIRRGAVRAIAVMAVLAIGGNAGAVEGKNGMVAAEHELAAQAGLRILQGGGNAIDAACAAALAVGVTNPSSCGIGGGGFMLIYFAKTAKLYALNYRERAPMAVRKDMFLRDGKPDDQLLRTGSLAVAVPGEIAGVAAALKRFGTMRFSAVAQPAIELAHEGFPCGAHLAREIAQSADGLRQDNGLKTVFLNPDGSARKEGETIVNQGLAATLQRLGDDPIEGFYHGSIADQIAAYMKSHGGLITTGDLNDYKVEWEQPLEGAYRGYDVYTMPPPSSGGGMLLEMLEMLAPGDAAGLGINSAPYLARLIEVMRQGFIDREGYGDPDFVKVPIGKLLSPEHIKRARDEALHRSDQGPRPTPGLTAAHDHGTSHLCVVDKEGNAVALTTTINTPFGAGMMVDGLGIILNNEMDDFAIAPGVANVYRLVGSEANAIAPGKRPLSSMTPTIVMKQDKPVLVLGGSGGPTIITGVLQVALDVLDFHLEPEKAVTQARIHNQAVPDVAAVEDAMPPSRVAALKAMGFRTRSVPMLGAVTAIAISASGIKGAGDPRKGGAAAGY